MLIGERSTPVYFCYIFLDHLSNQAIIRIKYDSCLLIKVSELPRKCHQSSTALSEAGGWFISVLELASCLKTHALFVRQL